MRKLSILLTLLLAVTFTTCSLELKRKPTLAIFPFAGSNTSDGEALAASFARRSELRNVFRVVPVTPAAIAAVDFERRFQRNSLTDPDTIFELGKKLNADYVVAGYITKLGYRNLILASIMDVESLRQIAGDYRIYPNFKGEINLLIPDMSRKLVGVARRNLDTKNLPGLSVPPFPPKGVTQNDAMVLAQILVSDLVSSRKYAVLPRTDSVSKVLEEHRRQRDGSTDEESIRRSGIGQNAQFVLNGSVERNKFAIDILNIENSEIIEGYEEEYRDLSHAIELMPKLAAKLAGTWSAAHDSNFVRIEDGSFMMGSYEGEGSDYEKPRHRVTISSFHMSKYLVTQREYEEVMGKNSSRFKGANLPVENVSWYDAIEYCIRRSCNEGLTPAYTIDKSKRDPNNTNDEDMIAWIVTWNRNANGYRLPTEAEWEYACRAGTTTPFSTGHNITTDQANYDGNYPYGDNAKGIYRGRTTPVDSFAPNRWGLYDMHGNVSEWCWDWVSYDAYGTGSARTDPIGPFSGVARVARGGGWDSSASFLCSARRYGNYPSLRFEFIGFRVVRP